LDSNVFTSFLRFSNASKSLSAIARKLQLYLQSYLLSWLICIILEKYLISSP
jgi:hypothetical protein